MRALGAAAVLPATLAAACGQQGTTTAPTGPDPAARAVPEVRLGPGETLAARVSSPVALRAAPRPDAPVLSRVGRRTPFGSRSVMAVARRRGAWLGVLWPTLPNGRIGWVPADQVALLRETWQIRVDLSRRRATLLHRGRPHSSFPVAIGAAGTPTPTGRYGVTDRLRTGGPGSPYGCCVLAISGRQPNVRQDWPGGDRLAIHGTDRPATIGAPASLGCLRAGERAMRELLAHVPLGAQVVIRR